MLLGAGNFFANLLLQSSAKFPKMKKTNLNAVYYSKMILKVRPSYDRRQDLKSIRLAFKW